MVKTNYTTLILTIISCLAYAFTGALVIITGMVMGDIAKYFHVTISKISNTFTFLNIGILIGILFNTWVAEVISLKKQIVYGFFLVTLALLGLIFCYNIQIFSLIMFIFGSVSGTIISIGTFLITKLYNGSQRASFLLLTDSFFSMSGMIFPILETNISINYKIPWYSIYLAIAFIYLLIFMLTILTKFPRLKNDIKKRGTIEEKWGMNVFYLSISALLYILGQLGFISWMPEYVIQTLNINIKKAGQMVSNFWMAYMIGMWLFSLILKFLDPHRILMFLTGISTILIYCFNHNKNIIFLKWIIISLGFFSSAIYTIIITLASLQTKFSSQKIINFILISGTIGTLLTFIITGPIVAQNGLKSALYTSNILYGIVFILCSLLGLSTKHRTYL